MKKHIVTLFSVFLILLGGTLIIYPVLSDYLNKLHQSKVIASYEEYVDDMTESIYRQMVEDAEKYNQLLSQNKESFRLNDVQKNQYKELLNVNGDGVMGYIEIPAIGITLPIYHGTDEAVLQIAAGHVEWSSLPVGGNGTHCVISGHRGLPSAKLFTDLDQVKEGDFIILKILNEEFIYQIDRISVVEPNDMKLLKKEPGKDFCTLVTCTPYGINTHRLLVRGCRVKDTVRIID